LDIPQTLDDGEKKQRLDGLKVRQSFFGVFDGHGGQLASTFVADQIHKNLVNSQHYPDDPKQAFEEACDVTDNLYREAHQFAAAQDGTTACMVLVIEDKLYTANVGDSRAVLCRNGKPYPLTNDHKPDKDSERKRIEDAGGIVKKGSFFNIPMGPFRVYLSDGVRGGLAVSRAIGDTFYKDATKPKEHWLISNIPDTSSEILDPREDEFFIIASDGFWDVFTNENAVTMTRQLSDQGMSPAEISHELTEKAFSRESLDNITVVVVKIDSPTRRDPMTVEDASSTTQSDSSSTEPSPGDSPATTTPLDDSSGTTTKPSSDDPSETKTELSSDDPAGTKTETASSDSAAATPSLHPAATTEESKVTEPLGEAMDISETKQPKEETRE